MANFVDNLIALRIVYLLSQSIEQTTAFKLGLIDKSGKTIKKAETDEERAATSPLNRLVWNIKRVFSLVPGGATKIGSLTAAYLLMKEQYEKGLNEEESLKYFTENFDRVWNIPFAEKELIEDAFEALLSEDAPVNATGSVVSTDIATKKPKIVRRFAEFQIDDDTFSKFKNGKAKYRRWNQYLNLEDASHKEIYDFAKKNPRGIIVLKDSKGSLKGIRYSRKGSGNWANIKRKPKQLAESVYTIYDEIEIIEI